MRPLPGQQDYQEGSFLTVKDAKMGVAVGPEYRLQPEVNKGLQAREVLFPWKKGAWERG